MKATRTAAPEKAAGTRPEGLSGVEAAGYVRALFDRIAPRYDRANHWLSLSVDRYWRRRAANHIRREFARESAGGAVLGAAAPVVLDVCCGTGDLAYAVAGRCPRARVLAADFTHRMLVLAREKERRSSAMGGTRAPQWFEADALCAPLRPAVADALTTAFGFRNLSDYRGALAEFHRLLKPGGALVILDFSSPSGPLLGPVYGWYFHRVLPRLGAWIAGAGEPYTYLPSSVDRFPEPEELADWMRAAGFVNVRFRRLSGGIAVLHTGNKSR